MPAPREGEEFFLNVPEKLGNPFPDLQDFREHRPVFYYPPPQTWFIFRYDDVTMLFQRFPGVRLDSSRSIQWYRNAGNRGPITLPLVF
jgi:cytochrome P450